MAVFIMIGMDHGEETMIYRAELSQPSGTTQLQYTSDSQAVAWTELLKEALVAIDTDRAYSIRMFFEHNENLWMDGHEILNKLLTMMSYENCQDTDWLLRNWESKCARFASAYSTESAFVSGVLTELMREQGYSIRQEAEYVIYDTWNFQLVDEQGKVLDWDGLYDTDPFPNYNQSYTGGDCQVRVRDEFDKLCIQIPFTEYSFLLAYGEQADPVLKAQRSDWNFVDNIVRTGATNGFVLLHYPEYIAYLKEKGWTEMPRPDSFKQAVESMWNEGKPLSSLMDVPQRAPLRSMAAVDHCLQWAKAQRTQQQQSVSPNQEQRPRNRFHR